MKSALLLFAITGQVQIMDAERLDAFRAVLPEYDDPRAAELFASPDTLWYTDNEMPVYHQDGMNLSGVFRADQNVAANPDGRPSNADSEFPWKVAGGIDPDAGVETVKVVRLPRVDGKLLPIVTWRADSLNVLCWTYPIGTQFGEVQFVLDDKGDWYPYETRLRIVEADEHEVDILRPVIDQAHLITLLNERGHQDIAKAVQEAKPRKRRMFSKHSQFAFDRTATIVDLPPMPTELIRELLSLPHQSAIGRRWSDTADGPTTGEKFHLVSQNFRGSHMGIEREQCAACHSTALGKVRAFTQNREWYGRVRGMAGILSFHVWGTENQNSIRPAFTKAGIVAKFDPRKHSKDNYRQNRFQKGEIRQNRVGVTLVPQ